jgi:hypothetical protein
MIFEFEFYLQYSVSTLMELCVHDNVPPTFLMLEKEIRLSILALERSNR